MKPKREAPRLPAPLALMSTEFGERPYLGASSGELLAGIPAPAPPLEPFRPPPPDWADEETGPPLPPPAEPAVQPLSALEALKLAHGDIDEPPPWAPPVPPSPPLLPVQIPEPDWRAEERERLARETEALAVEELPARYPPPRRENP